MIFWNLYTHGNFKLAESVILLWQSAGLLFPFLSTISYQNVIFSSLKTSFHFSGPIIICYPKYTLSSAPREKVFNSWEEQKKKKMWELSPVTINWPNCQIDISMDLLILYFKYSQLPCYWPDLFAILFVIFFCFHCKGWSV